MSLIVNITDKTLTNYPKAFLRIDTLVLDNQGIRADLVFYKDYSAYKANATPLFGGEAIVIRIHKNTQFFQNNFTTLATLNEGKTLGINLYQNLIKKINSSDSIPTFYKVKDGCDYNAQNPDDFELKEIKVYGFDQNGNSIELPQENPEYIPIIDLQIPQLQGLNLSDYQDSFTLAEFNASINGLSSIADGKKVFIEDLEGGTEYTKGIDF